MQQSFRVFVLVVVLALCALLGETIKPKVRATDLSGISDKSDCDPYSCNGCKLPFETMANGCISGWKDFCAVTDICDERDDCECSLNDCC